ncbi:MAG: hypothetical protein MJ249_10650 [Kiritimatiellae bacterium]|nr:hypothetical protein [Kiritimatiellia bacterium]
MPKLMDKNDWIQTVANVSAAERVWSANVTTEDGNFPLSMPEGGVYQVIVVKIDAVPEPVVATRKSAREMIGYGAKFHKLRTTDEWMRELREGEKE